MKDLRNEQENTLACLIMASGMAKRFGSNKLLTEFNGCTLLENAIHISRFFSFGKTLVVTRHEEVVKLCECENISVIKHDMPLRNEMVHLGVSHLLQKDSPLGILFLPADQPLISSASMQRLCQIFLSNSNKICRLSHDGIGGSPVIFPSMYYQELLDLPEGKGGGFLTKKYPEQVLLVPVQDPYELYDIDTPDDLTKLLQIFPLVKSHSK